MARDVEADRLGFAEPVQPSRLDPCGAPHLGTVAISEGVFGGRRPC